MIGTFKIPENVELEVSESVHDICCIKPTGFMNNVLKYPILS